MSFSLGIYDLFAYLIPGLLYLFVFNGFSRIIGWEFVDISLWLKSGSPLNAALVIPVLLFSYVVGHVIEGVANWFFFRAIYFLRIRKFQQVSSSALQSIIDKFPSLKIRFTPEDWDILFSLLRQRNIEAAHVVDKFQADSIMLRNIGFGLFMLSVVKLVDFLLLPDIKFVTASFGLLVFSVISFNRSAHFREWFFIEIFKASLEYGTSLKEVVEYSHQKRHS